MSIDTASDHEQKEFIKKWWKNNGVSIIVGLTIGLGAVFGWQFWQGYKTEQNIASSQQYEQITAAAGDETIIKKTEDFIKNNSSSYAVNAAFIAAEKAAKTGDIDKTRFFLSWIVNNAHTDSHKQTANLNLAKTYISEKKFSQAIKLLEGKGGNNYGGIYQMTLGDIYVLQGDKAAGRKAYEAALAALASNRELADIIQMKIDALN